MLICHFINLPENCTLLYGYFSLLISLQKLQYTAFHSLSTHNYIFCDRKFYSYQYGVMQKEWEKRGKKHCVMFVLCRSSSVFNICVLCWLTGVIGVISCSFSQQHLCYAKLLHWDVFNCIIQVSDIFCKKLCIVHMNLKMHNELICICRPKINS